MQIYSQRDMKSKTYRISVIFFTSREKRLNKNNSLIFKKKRYESIYDISNII